METITMDRADLDTSPKIGGSGGWKGCRDVWALDYEGKPAVVKYDYKNYWGNAEEVRMWDIVKDTDLAHYFAEVYAHSEDDRFLVMERADSVLCDHGVQMDDSRRYNYAFETEELTERYEQFRYDVIHDCARNGISVDDLHPGNIGLRADGTMVVIDYGYVERSDQQ